MIFYSVGCLLFLITIALGNTEKTIFLGPSSMQVPIAHPTLEDLQLDTLSPQNGSIRTHLQAQFPTDELEYGPDTWLLLSGLQEGQRYEVRVCWAATVI
jgi:subtilisin-like proprotein convertase family protein